MMPNWCENELVILGNRGELERFQKFGVSDEKWLDEKNFIPYPKEFEGQEGFNSLSKDEKDKAKIKQRKELMKKYGADNGYDFSLKYYGTKWGICNLDKDSEYTPNYGKRTLTYYFETAWSPPIPVVLEMSKQFPALRFSIKYWEGGAGYRGIFVCKAGKVVKAQDYKYSGNRGG